MSLLTTSNIETARQVLNIVDQVATSVVEEKAGSARVDESKFANFISTVKTIGNYVVRAAEYVNSFTKPWMKTLENKEKENYNGFDKFVSAMDKVSAGIISLFGSKKEVAVAA